MKYTERLQYRESVRHGSDGIPWQHYECRLPEFCQSVPLHCHPELELMAVHAGSGVLVLDEERLALRTGSICLILPDQIHGIEGDLEYDTLVFSGDLLPGSLGERSFQDLISRLLAGDIRIRQPLDPGCAGYDRIREAVTDVFTAADENSAVWDLLLKSALLRILHELFAHDLVLAENGRARQTETFKPVLGYIQSHYQEKIEIATLADLMHISESHFLHLFRKAFQISPLDYINQIRIQKACLMLTQTDLNIAEVALDCGFFNLSNFNRQFRRRTGQTPHAFRQVNTGSAGRA